MIGYWNFHGCVLLATGFAIGVFTYSAIAGAAGESLVAKAIAWIVSGVLLVFCDVLWLINRFRPMPKLSWLLAWSGGLAGFPICLYGFVILLGGICFACSLSS